MPIAEEAPGLATTNETFKETFNATFIPEESPLIAKEEPRAEVCHRPCLLMGCSGVHQQLMSRFSVHEPLIACSHASLACAHELQAPQLAPLLMVAMNEQAAAHEQTAAHEQKSAVNNKSQLKEGDVVTLLCHDVS